MKTWKTIPIPEYKGLYMVSNKGDVFSIARGDRLTPTISKNGYKRVSLSHKGKAKKFFVHRLVALAFIPNPDNKPTVNHINEIKTDNRVENLEWATNLEQNIHGTRLQRAKQNTDYKARNIDYKSVADKHNYSDQRMCNRKRCAVYKEGNLVGIYLTQKEASEAVGVSRGKVSSCASGRIKSCRGYEFKEIGALE